MKTKQLLLNISILLLTICTLSAANHTVSTAEPPKDPILWIETGRHTATIRRIATDAAGRWLVTASDDKTLRIWDLAGVGATGRSPLQDMQPARIIRPPIGEGDEGKNFSAWRYLRMALPLPAGGGHKLEATLVTPSTSSTAPPVA